MRAVVVAMRNGAQSFRDYYDREHDPLTRDSLTTVYNRPMFERRPYAIPRLHRLWGKPAQVADRLAGIRHPLKDKDPIFVHPPEFSGPDFCYNVFVLIHRSSRKSHIL